MIPEIGTMHRERGSYSGFTLVELLLVISVMGIIAAIVMPALGSWRSRLNASQSAKNIVDVLRESKSKTMSTNYQLEVSFDLANRKYRVLRSGSRQSYNTTVWNTDHPVRDWVQLPTGLTLRSGTGQECDSSANVKVQFNGDGTARLESPWLVRSATPVIMCVQEGPTVIRTIRIAQSGRITVD